MRVAVVGLGKIGLPLAVQFAVAGHDVLGCDVSTETVQSVTAGLTPFPGEKDLPELLAASVRSGRLSATTNTAEAVARCEVVVVAVPLYAGDHGNPDFSIIDAATDAIAEGIQPGSLVVYETTLPVGTTRERLAPALAERSGLVLGLDLFVAFSPERVLTGRVFSDLRSYPKLVGGVDAESEARGIAFYESALTFEVRPDLVRPNGVWSMGSSDAAEMAKLAETTFRDVNIALANQFALFAKSRQIDFAKVVQACNSQPYSMIHRPGIAVGGHCIPVYPKLYLWNDPAATVVESARNANAGMPDACVQLLEDSIGSLSGLTAAVLGAAYRGGVKETAFSGVFAVQQALRDRGARVKIHDPLYSDDELVGLGFDPYVQGTAAELVIVQADHAEYSTWTSFDVPGVVAVFDGRGVLSQSAWAGTEFVSLMHRPDRC